MALDAFTSAPPPPADIRGLVFDVHRCSLHDGPGIRTTIFLKGCPLRCLWCHNPESQSFHREVAFAKDRCVSCSACVEVCQRSGQLLEDGVHTMDHGPCVACGSCVDACAYGGLRMVGQERSVRDLIDLAMRDVAYYQSSGGGVTLSGGEPTAQAEFCTALLRGARMRGLHTVLQTCGISARAVYEGLLPFTDLFLYDYKATDSNLHRDLTGVPNDRILSNLEFLIGAGARVVLRCPLIPGVNDDEAHLAGIAALSRRFPSLEGIELMAYHTLGRGKAEQIGREYPLPEIPAADDATRDRWLSTLARLGCTRAVVG
jgi:glycyl-radical enzyme activating protein